MGNPIMSIFGGGGSSSIFMQAVGSFMRGESPRDFLQKLAKTNPALSGIDVNDINGSAQRLCQERGVDADKLTAEIRQKISTMK